MTHGKFNIVRAMCLLLVLTILVSGCGNGAAPAEEAQPPTDPPTQPPTDGTTVEPPTGEPEPPAWLGTICPEVGPLAPNDPAFTPVFGEITQEADFFIRTGLYTNKFGQTFDVTVKGTVEEVVGEYTENLRVCMELLSYKPPEFETNVTDEATGDDLSEEDVLLQNPENLLIISNPSEANKEAFGDGYIWVYVIDPSIANTAKHDYRKYCRDSASTTVTVGATGSVKGTHYRRPPGGVNSSSTKSVLASQSKSWSYAGKATYDLQVEGTSAGTTSYRVSGTIWNFGFTSSPPGGGGSNCP